jgi:hypothetical protein
MRVRDEGVFIVKESHGDWLACEHNSALANSLKSKYGMLEDSIKMHGVPYNRGWCRVAYREKDQQLDS